MEKSVPVKSEKWQESGACIDKDPNIFQPTDGGGVARARKICVEQCVVRQECLDFALANKIKHGVWGGTSERERGRILGKKR